MNINLPTVKMRGRYKIQIRDAAGIVHTETDWFDNLITNTGLDWYGSGVSDYAIGSAFWAPLFRCAVGTNNTPPTNTDTTLGAQIATQPPYSVGGGSPPVSSPTYVAGPPAYFTASIVYTFALGAVIGNIAEIGVGCFPVAGGAPTSGTKLTLFSHALIQSGGSPTTISVTGADQLIVTFELRYYINTTDTPYSVIISGITYTGTMRSLNQNIGTGFSLGGTIDNTSSQSNTTSCQVYNGSLGTVTSPPSGSSVNIGSAPIPAYTGGTYTKSYTFSANTSSGNLSGGITALVVQSSFQCWQFSLSPTLPKDNTKTMTLTFSYSWARYP